MPTYEEMKGAEYKLKLVSMRAKGPPPWKQAPADGKEKLAQQERRSLLQAEAHKALSACEPAEGPVSRSITYRRAAGRSDAANIIGGIADTLEGIVYQNDRQVIEIHYVEEDAVEDEYEVTISLL